MGRKRKIKNWMGEDWTVEEVKPDDYRLTATHTNAILDYKQQNLLYAVSDDNTTITRIMHEAVHRATGWGSEDELEELHTEHAAISLIAFLRGMGVDLSPLL